jgi:hypothetical protein
VADPESLAMSRHGIPVAQPSHLPSRYRVALLREADRGIALARAAEPRAKAISGQFN